MSGTQGIQFTYNDYNLIQDIHSYGGETFKLLVNSLFPAIFGQSLVKAGLVRASLILGLFGTNYDQNSGNLIVLLHAR